VLWKRGADSLKGLADAWSPPAIARVRLSGAAQNGEHFVLIIGGGYANATSVSAGNRIFMLDAATGQRLWSAGGVSPDETPDLQLEKMIHPVPAGVAVLDVDGDDYADRFYAVDLAGQVFRFDVWNGRARTELVTGGVLADLSAPASPGLPVNGSARFFNRPDVALIVPRAGAPYYNVALGSGDADGTAPPLVPNRFYSIRDSNAFTALTQPAYDGLDTILATDLIDITADVNARVPRDAKGWRMDLAPPDVLALGEQVLSESITVNKVVLFTTYQPERSPESAPADDGACEQTGSSRVYAVRVDSGAAAVDLDSDGEITPSDRSLEMQHAGPPAAVSIEIATPSAGGTVRPPTDAPPDNPGAPQPPSPNEAVQCIVGTRVLKTCVPFSPLQRTYWHHATVE
jgi:type IV pilus assembly protein PilY1